MSAEVDEHNPNLWYVFPTMIPPKRITEGNTKNEWLQFDDNRQALEHNIKFGNIKIFSNKEDAITYAEGGYKEDTDLEITDDIKKYYDDLLNQYFKGELQW